MGALAPRFSEAGGLREMIRLSPGALVFDRVAVGHGAQRLPTEHAGALRVGQVATQCTADADRCEAEDTVCAGCPDPIFVGTPGKKARTWSPERFKTFIENRPTETGAWRGDVSQPDA